MQRRHRSAYSWRAKLGLIVPPTNTVNEAEWARMMPDGVTFHTVRMPIHMGHLDEAARRQLEADLAVKVRELAEARVDCVAYACTAGSMISPRHQLPDAVSALTGTKVVTTAASIVDALAWLGARRVSVATPYHDALNEHEVEFLGENGIEVLGIVGLGLGANGPVDFPRIAETPLDVIDGHVRDCVKPGSDAVLITCTDFPSLALIERLEADTGLPVVTSNTATLWAALAAVELGDPVAGAGQLLARKGRSMARSLPAGGSRQGAD